MKTQFLPESIEVRWTGYKNRLKHQKSLLPQIFLETITRSSLF